MPQTVNEVMTADPRTVAPGDSVVDAARQMKEADVGDVLVVQDGRPTGIVTDRDIVVRCIAEGGDPSTTRVADVASEATATIAPDQPATEAARLMREHDVRRLVVVQDGRLAGIVSIGDLAIALDDESALADISAAPPNR
jgi:CBS domain-containing protein